MPLRPRGALWDTESGAACEDAALRLQARSTTVAAWDAADAALVSARSSCIRLNICSAGCLHALPLICVAIVSSQKKKVTAERDAYKLTLRTLETLEDGASPQETAHLKVRSAFPSAGRRRGGCASQSVRGGAGGGKMPLK